MALETGTYIDDLVVTNPVSGDPKSQGDDHLRLLKSTIKTTFPNITGEVTPTQVEINRLDGITGPAAAKDGETFTGTNDFTGAVITVPNQSVGTSGMVAANVDYVNATVTEATLPGQAGNDDKIMTTDGTTADWSAEINTAVVKPAAGTDFATLTQTQTLTDKTLTDLIIADDADPTKKANFIVSGVTAGQNRNLTIPDNNVTVDTPGWRLISVLTPSAAASPYEMDVFSSTYDDYVAVCDLRTQAGSGGYTLTMQVKIGGSYITGSVYRYHMNKTSSATALYVGFAGNPDVAGSIKLISADFGSQSDHSASFMIKFFNVNNATVFKNMFVEGIYRRENDEIVTMSGVAGIDNTGALQGFRFGGLASFTGTVKLFGIRKSI